jgi:rRNA maturation endonuclease Nob1
MTIEKAIEQLEDLIKDRESFCHHDDFDEVFLQDIEACKMGIQALEKHVPKKVKKEFVTVNGCITCFETDVCPVCGNDFYIEDLGQTMYYAFCPDCGQALDWSDENE